MNEHTLPGNEGIAIVGIDCRYPGAHSLNEYWENILSLRQQFRQIPEKRLNLAHYGSADKNAIDTTYSKNAAVLSGYHFDRLKYRISKSTYDQTDLAHWLGLDVASGALKDAGFEDGVGLNKERVGVIIGNSLTGEFTRANVMRIRWPYVSKVMHATLSALSYGTGDIDKILSAAEDLYKKPFPEPNADMLAGGLSNTIAGRICNYYDFNGGGYTIDGACSSSLLAVANACNALLNGELDVALAGGVDLSIDPFELIGFARNGALATTEMEVFSAKAQGFWPGEGCGMVVLMKESEAIKNGQAIYGVIRGWGISSDGKGGMTRPKIETQQLAMERAYLRAGYDASTVSLFEAHGTGTVLGDEIEISGILNTVKKYGRATGSPAVLGSVKQLIGHTKAAAGVAGLIKALLSLKHKIIPAAIKTSAMNPLLEKNRDHLMLLDKPQLWDQPDVLRAGVSSFGFGGINVHVTLEEDQSRKRMRKAPPSLRKLANSKRDVEIFPITESGLDSFVKKLEMIQRVAKSVSRAELTDLSVHLSSNIGKASKYKACIVARTPDELYERAGWLLQQITTGMAQVIDLKQGVFYSEGRTDLKNAFLFPGQGAPTYNDLHVFNSLNFEYSLPVIKAKNTGSDEPLDTSEAQPLIINSTLHALELLQFYGVEAEYSIGHSLGEIASLVWGGAVEPEMATKIAAVRGQMMSEHGEKGGGMLALKCTEEAVHELIRGYHEVNITGYNGADSYVIGGKMAVVEEIQRIALERGIHNTKLRVSHAFHTPMMRESALQFKQELAELSLGKVSKKVISTVNGASIEGLHDLQTHLFEQIEKPVLFKQAIEQIKDKTLFYFEVGPGATLTKSLQGYDDVHVIPIDFGSPSLQGFLSILGAAFISGNEINFRELSTGRHYNHFDLEKWELDVLENPCEAITHTYTVNKTSNGVSLDLVPAENTPAEVLETAVRTAPITDTLEGITGYIKQLVSEKMDMPVDFISGEDRIMSQLHINSLALVEIISVATKAFNKSHKTFSSATMLASADGTIAEISQLIFEGEGATQQGSGFDTIDTEKLYNWTHIFKRYDVAKPAGKQTAERTPGETIVSGNPHWASLFREKISTTDTGNTAVYVYTSGSGTSYLEGFLQFLKDPVVRSKQLIVLVDMQQGTVTGDLQPVFRSFHQEMPHINAFTVSIDQQVNDPAALLMQELQTVSKYKEVHFDKDGNRTESECTVYFSAADTIEQVLGEEDVILATGGGKGITYESISALANITHAKLAIMGRAKPEQDQELFANLEKLAKSGIHYRYYAVDVLDKDKVQQAVNQVRNELGTITVVVHGAGVNHPKRLDSLTMADFERTLSVKLTGLQHVVDALPADKLKLLIGYGSVIAQSGMKGNADYAWANDQMALYIAELGNRYPQGRFITLEWSVWEDTGMGVMLNSIEALKLEGIMPIPVKNALQQLQYIIADPNADNGRYMILGRFGKTPTLVFSKRRPPAGRFISKVQHHIPNVEVITDVPIDLNSDIYLTHHQLDGQYIMPTVMILEGMAQVVSFLHPAGKHRAFEDLVIDRAIFVPKEGSRTIRFIATRIAENKIQVSVHSDETNFESPCFSATACCAPNPIFDTQATLPENLEAVQIDIDTQFYDNLLFHTGPFRRIREFYQITALESVALTNSASPDDQWFASFLPEDKLLGDPGLNDAAIHCHQACRPSQTLLPVRAKQIIFNPEKVEGPLYIKTVELYETGNDTTIDVQVVNQQGEIKMIWKELVLRRITARGFKGKWHPVFLKPFLEYTLNHLSESRNNRIVLDDCIRVNAAVENGLESPAIETAGYLLQFGLATSQSDNNTPNPMEEIPLRLSGSDLPFKLRITSAITKPIQQD